MTVSRNGKAKADGSTRPRSQALERLFGRKPVVDLDDLRGTLGTSSRTTVFRALRRAGYLTSYSHAGRYYTLRRIPVFDNRGLWFHGDVRFSVHGTLRATLVVLIRQASAGHTHDELAVILGLRVHDTLRNLVEEKQIGRERIESVYIYIDVDPDRARAQLSQRQQTTTEDLAGAVGRPAAPVELARVVDVLLAVIHAPKDDARTIAGRLRANGLLVDDEQVEAVFAQYALGKKTARPRSKRSRR
ncbi:hypothetical protein H8D79_01675 [PVC group bacterium]|nr:hypothetical protein [PVC group bacterium]